MTKKPPGIGGLPNPKLLAAARVLAGFSQDSLAAEAQVHKTVLARYEAGRTLMRVDTLARVVQVLEMRGVRFTPPTEHLEMGLALAREQPPPD